MAWVRPKRPRRAPVDIYQDPTEPLRNVLQYFSCQPNAAANPGAGDRYKIVTPPLQQQRLLPGPRSPERAPPTTTKTKTHRQRSSSETYEEAGRHHHARDGYEYERGGRREREWDEGDDNGDCVEDYYEDDYDNERSERHRDGYEHERPREPRRIEPQEHGRRHQHHHHHQAPPEPTRRAFSSEVRPRYAAASARAPHAAPSAQRRALSSRWGDATTALAI